MSFFRGRVLYIRAFSPDGYADSVSPVMNTITSRDQFNPISLGVNLVVGL